MTRDSISTTVLRCMVMAASIYLPASWAGEIRVVLFDIAPYASQADGRSTGIYVELAERIARKAGLQAQLEIVPFARVGHLLASDQADLTISFSTEQLEKVAVPVLPVRTVKSVVLLAPGRMAQRPVDLAGLQIGRLRGGCHDLMEQSGVGVKPYEINNFPSGIRMLSAQRIDGLCATQDVIEHYVAQEGLSMSGFGPMLVISQREAWVHVRKTLSAEMQRSIRQAISDLREMKQL